MRKWIVLLLFLITVLLLISVAFLPALAGVLQDAGTQKTVSHRPLHSIAPYISENGSGLFVEDKLKILQESEISSIVPAMASMTEEQVRTAVEARLQPYIQASIVRSFASWEFYATPYVAISWKNASHWFLFWEVSLVDVSDGIQQSLTVTVDDETGVFLQIHYYDPFALEDWHQLEDASLPLMQFSQIWLEQAGLWESARQLTPDSEGQQIQSMHPGTRQVVYVFTDGAEHLLYINFSVSGYGEYTMWIESMPQ